MPKYINAENAEKSLRQYAEQKHANGEIELANGILKAVCRLKTIPTADVKEVVRGKWVKDRDCFVCSNCRAAVSMVYPSTWAGCPYCLTDMREVE